MTCIILSGGAGTRMGGREKAFLTLDGETFIERKLRFLKPVFSEILIVVNTPVLYEGLDAVILQDEIQGSGPLMGMYTGLKHSSSDKNFITSVDSPYVHTGLIHYLLESPGDWDAHVPMWRGFLEPLYAVYRKTCIPHIEKVLDRKKIIIFYDAVRMQYAEEEVIKSFDSQGNCFININSMEDYTKLTGDNK